MNAIRRDLECCVVCLFSHGVGGRCDDEDFKEYTVRNMDITQYGTRL